MVYTLSVSLEIQSHFTWIFLNVVDTDETLCCDVQKSPPRATYSASQEKCIRIFFNEFIKNYDQLSNTISW